MKLNKNQHSLLKKEPRSMGAMPPALPLPEPPFSHGLYLHKGAATKVIN